LAPGWRASWATPALGFLGLWGSARAVRRREQGWELVALAWIPAAYFTFRAAVMADFYPWPASRWSRQPCRSCSPVMPWRSWPVRPAQSRLPGAGDAVGPRGAVLEPTGGLAEWARPLAPIGSLPPGIVEAADWLKGKRGG